MDGCTMATDSYFASTMVEKLLRKNSRSFVSAVRFHSCFKKGNAA
jgi:hypothetical protein